MSEKTKIQWTDSTVNPVAGCNGCELFPTTRGIVHEIERLLLNHPSAAELPPSLREEMLSHGPTELRRDRGQWARRIVTAVDAGEFSPSLATDIEQAISALFRCYAANLTGFFNSKGTHPGYPRTFEEPTKFPGRMAKAAKLPVLTGEPRADKPWLDGLPRIEFISDMGDALSREIGFDYLKREIVDTVVSDSGRQHIWIWLTKRPTRMAEFGHWLAEQGVTWPDNLVAATTITDNSTLKRLDALRQVPAKFRMVSIEPLIEEVVPDLTGIDWAIVGGESGHYARPFDVSWIKPIQSACEAHKTALFVKQLGARPVQDGHELKLKDAHGGDWSEWSEELRIRQVPDAWKASH